MSARLKKLEDLVRAEFSRNFEGSPVIVNSPGRINLLGEHTDYNGGHVLPAAIDHSIVMAIAPNDTDKINAISIDFDQACEVCLKNPKPLGNWSDYIVGVALEMKKHNGQVRGFDMVFTGDVPIGSGLSSSAALECGTALALNELYQTGMDRRALSHIAQAAENNHVGVQCGIMDQYASLFGQKDTFICLDCKEVTHQYLKMDLTDHVFVLCNSGVNHQLASSDYNVRRNQCQEGLEVIRAVYPEVNWLCDVPLERLKEFEQEMDPVVYRRCLYVIKENSRVLAISDAISNNDVSLVGRLMYETHHGLQEEYEVSCPELDYLVERTREEEGVLGSRMMGGGFGGCTINLVRKASRDYFNDCFKQTYHDQFGIELTYIDVSLTDGGAFIP